MLYRKFRQKIHKQNSDKVWIEDSQTEFTYKVLIENLDQKVHKQSSNMRYRRFIDNLNKEFIDKERIYRQRVWIND